MINNKEKKMIQRYCIYPKIAVVALIFSFVQCALIVPLEMIDDLVFQNKGFQPTGMFTALGFVIIYVIIFSFCALAPKFGMNGKKWKSLIGRLNVKQSETDYSKEVSAALASQAVGRFLKESDNDTAKNIGSAMQVAGAVSTVSTSIDMLSEAGSNTVLRKTIGTNFKTDERRFATDEERLLFEDTHEPIVDGELWEQAHRRLKHATRRIKEGTHQEECLLPGLVYCADCGSKMSYQTNYYKSGEPYHSFRCSSYGNRTVNCTIHHISDKVLYQLVLRSIQRLSSHIIADERGFAEELKSKWEAQANGKPQKQKDELQIINRRLNELDRLIGSLYENFISGLLPEKQYKSLMKKYSAEQDSLESQVSEIQEKLEQTKASSAHIGRFIRLIKKYKQPTELTKEMACELIDKIVVHEAVGKKPNRQQQVDIYYNFIGQFDLPLSEKEIAEARQKAEQEAAEKAKRKKNRQRESNVAHQAKAKAERWAANDGHKYPKRVCEQCGKEFYPSSTRQRFCNTDCTKAHQQAEKEKKRFAEKGEHTFRQKVCKICGKPFWPSNGQEVLCSEECKAINRRQKQLAYYHRKQSEQKAGEAI